MCQCDYQFYAALETHGGEHIADVPLDVDWIPALRWAEFEHRVRRGLAHPVTPVPAVIEPLWSESAQEPYLHGVRVRTTSVEADAVELPLVYFSDAVASATSGLIGAGTIVSGQTFEYRVFALPDTSDRPGSATPYNVVAEDDTPDIGCEEISPLLALAESRGAVAGTPDVPVDAPMPIFIPQALLEEVTELGRNADDVETGGILLGKLWRDPSGTLFSRVTAQIPAVHAEATRTSLRFTPRTWASVADAAALRGRGEMPLGWWHSHPFFCRHCTTAKRLHCPFSVPAFSAADRGLHREVFQKSWNVALLLSFLGDRQPSYDVFAWNKGQITAASFYSLPACGEY